MISLDFQKFFSVRKNHSMIICSFKLNVYIHKFFHQHISIFLLNVVCTVIINSALSHHVKGSDLSFCLRNLLAFHFMVTFLWQEWFQHYRLEVWPKLAFLYKMTLLTLKLSIVHQQDTTPRLEHETCNRMRTAPHTLKL